MTNLIAINANVVTFCIIYSETVDQFYPPSTMLKGDIEQPVSVPKESPFTFLNNFYCMKFHKKVAKLLPCKPFIVSLHTYLPMFFSLHESINGCCNGNPFSILDSSRFGVLQTKSMYGFSPNRYYNFP